MHPYLTSGVTGAAPIWNKVMSYVLKNQSDLWPVRPQNVVGRQVCWETGNAVEKKEDGTESCQSRFEYFIKGYEFDASEIKKEKINAFVPEPGTMLVI